MKTNTNDMGILISSWVPQKVANKFLVQYKSLDIGEEAIRESIKGGEDTHLVFKPKKNMKQVITLYQRQKKAIQAILTIPIFEKFWQSCTEEKAELFFNIWSKAWNDWVLKPDITDSEKRKKIKQVEGCIEKIIEIRASDSSLLREISIAFIESINHQWPELNITSEEAEALETIHISHLLNRLLKELKEIRTTSSWRSTHNIYPTHIKQPTAEGKFFRDALAPIVTEVLGKNDFAYVSDFISALFPHKTVKREDVRNAVRGKK